ncbi:hypothetical protein ACKUSY_15705 [Myroides odoratus]
MPLIVPILFVTVLQIGGYLYLDQKGWGRWKWVWPIFLAFTYFFVLMPFYMPKYEEMEIKCAMPALGVFLAILFFGLGGLIVIHLLYMLIRFLLKKNTTPNKPDEK